MPPALRNPALLAYAAVYAALLWSMHLREGFDTAEPLFVLAVIGIGFTLLAVWTTRRLEPRAVPVRHPIGETGVLAAYLLVVVVFITWGIPLLRRSHAGPAGAVWLVLVGKLVVFVGLPLVLWRALWGYRTSELAGRPLGLRGHWRPVVWMSAVFLVFQLVFGRAVGDLRAADPGAAQLAVGIPLAFVWLLLEVGLVEEFFFRALLQTRIAALVRSEVTAVVLTALLFGLAHAPGLYLRPEATGEALGRSPSLLGAIGYSVVLTSVTGFFLGTLWARTRNLAVVAVVHAFGDLLPNLVDLLRTWRLV